MTGAEANRLKAEERAKVVLEMQAKGLTYAEIGEQLKVTADVARQIVSRHNKRHKKEEKPKKRFYIRSEGI